VRCKDIHTAFRSESAHRFGPPINASEYADEFMGDDPKSAVKKLSARILTEMRRLTVTAPDWQTWDRATMARQLLWRFDTDIPLPQFRSLFQRCASGPFCLRNAVFTQVHSLVEHFADDKTPNGLKRVLTELTQALKEANLTSSSLGPTTLPRDLDPSKQVPLPSRLSTLFTLVKSTLSSLVRLPFFAIPLAVHLPVYCAGKLVIPLVNPSEPESFAQNKIVFGLLLLALTVRRQINVAHTGSE
jgi:glycerol-3-phosphate O-acyltransferase / dihydroxyacetone phosphate acyltransferase